MHEFEKGLVADRGVDGRGAPLPAFHFFDYEEMCRFLTDRFHNKLADRDGVHDILYGGRGRGLDASTCITAIDADKDAQLDYDELEAAHRNTHLMGTDGSPWKVSNGSTFHLY